MPEQKQDRGPGARLVRRVARVLVWGLAAVLALLGVLVLGGATWNSLCTTRDRSRFRPPGQLVEVDGRKLHLHCTGQGQPTVILDSGFSLPALSWALVQPELSRRTRVCSYDRVGLGHSEPDPRFAPQTSGRMAERLHALLERGGVRGPLVLVGHSNGGYLVRSYYARFPAEVVGAVLVDASHERMDEHFVGPMWEPAHRDGQAREHRWLPVWRFLSWSGVLRGGLTLLSRSSKLPLPRDVVDEAIFLFSQPAWRPSTVAEGDGIPESVAEMRSGRGLGSLPLVVLTAGRFQPRGVPDRGDYWNQLWVKELQPQLARLSTRGRQVVADSGHLIPFEAPGAVVQAVSEVLGTLAAKPQ
ncbi:MAG: alpha/beta hydrolase [Polyangia bacterium]